MKWLLLLAVLSACGPSGDYTCAHSEAVTFSPGVSRTNLCPKIDYIHAAAERVCSSAGSDISRISIFVEGTDFQCGGILVHGCTVYPNKVYVRDQLLLPDEIGHLVWFSCFNRSGEHTNDAGFIVYDSDFNQFVESLQ